MSKSEFDIIKTYFSPLQINSPQTLLGIGDDAALLDTRNASGLCVSIDTLNVDVHFPSNINAELIAYKALAVNISDMAAMGAKPIWFTLALSMPNYDEEWLSSFAKGLASIASEHDLNLIGGDTTRGPLSITIQIAGNVEQDLVMRRSDAKVGDAIYVTGNLAEASTALAVIQGSLKLNRRIESHQLQRKLMCRPSRAKFAVELAAVANACIDISDGLTQDLSHILKASKLGARLEKDKIPLSNFWLEQGVSSQQCLNFALSGGDDFELCFTVSQNNIAQLEKLANDCACPIQKIGETTSQLGLSMWDGVKLSELAVTGYDHFQN